MKPEASEMKPERPPTEVPSWRVYLHFGREISVADTPVLVVPRNPQLAFICTPPPKPQSILSCLKNCSCLWPNHRGVLLRQTSFKRPCPTPALSGGRTHAHLQTGLAQAETVSWRMALGLAAQMVSGWLEVGMRQSQGWRRHFLRCAFNQIKTSHSVIRAKRGGWCGCGGLVTPSFPSTTVISLGWDC